MTYELILGDYAYSSWSLRAWLLFDRFGISRNLTLVDFSLGSVPDQMPGWAPAKTVPALRTSDGAIIGESIALAEELASRHSDLPLWPSDPAARATARSLTAEMHAGFGALRSDCPMNLRRAYTNVPPSAAVEADLRRIEVIWDHARQTCAPSGPWLCGDYSIVDAFYAPVAARIAGYGLRVSDSAQAYVDAHLNDLSFRRWRAMGLVRGPDLNRYKMDHATTTWPGPTPIAARAVEDGTPENTACPYSGKAITHLMETDGRIFGMCNPFCRDKTVADPDAWPAFTTMRDS
ncbi:glutathione S-transferase [Roseovarius pelagicus]|uniref:Glutathione S-transferase n=1 Tax=Roseovarius pelagicus TaxID=2980108 RepID=A0ABY6DG12_9RHOB|nr:glutathione S-transferase [Roseovarius pelagicus]UXX85054.1 glutathione S-transferase [Roseovarius pelagicus]